MSNIKNHEEHTDFSMQRLKARMKLPHIMCPSCKGSDFRVAIANLSQSRRMILDCASCKTRASIWVKGWDKRGDKRSSWDFLEFSKEKDIVN